MSSVQSSEAQVPNKSLDPAESKASTAATNGKAMSITGVQEAEDVGQEVEDEGDEGDEEDEVKPSSVLTEERRKAAQVWEDEAFFAFESDVDEEEAHDDDGDDDGAYEEEREGSEEEAQEEAADDGDDKDDDEDEDDEYYDDDDDEDGDDEYYDDDDDEDDDENEQDEYEREQRFLMETALAVFFTSMHVVLPGLLMTLSIAGYALQPRKNLYLVTALHGNANGLCKFMTIPKTTPISDLYNAVAEAFAFSNFSADNIDLIKPANSLLAGVKMVIRINEHRERVHRALTVGDLDDPSCGIYSLQVLMSVYFAVGNYGDEIVLPSVVNMRYVGTTVVGENDCVTNFPFLDDQTKQAMHRRLNAVEANMGEPQNGL